MTDLDLRAGQIHRGLGVVARWPDIAVVIPSDSAHDSDVDAMFDELGPEPTSQTMLRSINDLLAAEKLRSVGMLVEATGGPMAVAYGAIEILADGEVLLDGSQGLVKVQMPLAAHRLTVRASNLSKAAEPVAPFDLRRGVAPGAGLTLLTVAAAKPDAPANVAPPAPEVATPTPATREDPEEATEDGFETDNSAAEEPVSDQVTDQPVAVPSIFAQEGNLDAQSSDPFQSAASQSGNSGMEVPFRSVVLVGAQPAAELTPLRSAAADGEGAASIVDERAIEVSGILCPRDHFNNPAASYCMVCGLSMAHLARNQIVGARPTLGFIVFDDGATYGLDRSYLIGREPNSPEDGVTELLVLHDNNETLSRHHAKLELIDWTVHLTDLESTNGTYVWDVSFERWNQLSPQHSVELMSGDTVALGRRTFVFEGIGLRSVT